MSTTVMDDIARQVHTAQARINALDTELFDLSTHRRALAFDAATGNDEAKKALANIERSIAQATREKATCEDIVTEGAARLQHAEEEMRAEERAGHEAEYARLTGAREQLYEEWESLIAGLVALVPQITAADVTMHGLGAALDIRQGRRAVDAIDAYAGNRLTYAGLRLQGPYTFTAYDAPLSASKLAEWEAARRIKREEEEEAAMIRRRAVPPDPEEVHPLMVATVIDEAQNEEVSHE